MHGNVPDLEPFYNSVQDTTTFLELIDSFEVQCMGLHIDKSRWARLLATYFRHSAVRIPLNSTIHGTEITDLQLLCKGSSH